MYRHHNHISLFCAQILDYPRLDPRIRPRIIEILARLAQRSGLYPQSLFVRGLHTEQTFPLAGGAYGDVYEGRVNDRRVAAKVIRVFQNTDFKSLHQVGYDFFDLLSLELSS